MRFRVKAIRGLSEVTVLPVDAANEANAIAFAEHRGYDVISIRRSTFFAPRSRRQSPRFATVHFSQELVALLRAGLTVVEAVEILHRKEQHVSTREVLDQLLLRLRQGMRFSSALESFPLLFSPLYLAIIRASERSGSVADALTRFVGYQLEIAKVRSKVVSASIYPAVLLAVGSLVVLFLITYVLPRFSRIYEDIGGDLPVASQFLMLIGRLVQDNHVLLAIVVGASAAAAYYAKGNARIRAALVRKFWQLPVIRPKKRIYELAQFYRTISMLLRSGHTVLGALDMSRSMLSPALREKLSGAIESVKQGKSFASAMSQAGLTTDVAYSMMQVSERSGSLSEMLDVVALFHEEELGRWVDWFSRLFEPVLMAFIGIVIGVIVVFMYMPVFELAESIK